MVLQSNPRLIGSGVITYSIRQNSQPENDTESTGNTITVSIVETACSAEGLALTTWSSAFILSNLLHRIQVNLKSNNASYNVLELGAGTGLSGISAAALWGASTMLTDLPTIVPGLEENASLNRNFVAQNGGKIGCGTLDWKTPNALEINNPGLGSTKIDNPKFPVILAADTMYTDEHPLLLSQTILQCLEKTRDAKAIVVYAMRIAYIEEIKVFWELMEEGGLVAVQDGREEANLEEWDDEKLHEWSIWQWKPELLTQ